VKVLVRKLRRPIWLSILIAALSDDHAPGGQ